MNEETVLELKLERERLNRSSCLTGKATEDTLHHGKDPKNNVQMKTMNEL